MSTFEPFPKLARLSRECTITEKIDGTNAQVYIVDPETLEGAEYESLIQTDPLAIVDGFHVFAGSRTRLIWPGKDKDNFGFAGWVWTYAQELVKLGPGRHYGEWWGKGIQRGYGHPERRFSLFDTKRWSNPYGAMLAGHEPSTPFPKCCDVVPVIYRGDFTTDAVSDAMNLLEVQGSWASAGFMKPEGVVVWHSAARVAFKKTFEKDATGKEANA